MCILLVFSPKDIWFVCTRLLWSCCTIMPWDRQFFVPTVKVSKCGISVFPHFAVVFCLNMHGSSQIAARFGTGIHNRATYLYICHQRNFTNGTFEYVPVSPMSGGLIQGWWDGSSKPMLFWVRFGCGKWTFQIKTRAVTDATTVSVQETSWNHLWKVDWLRMIHMTCIILAF